MHLSSRILLVVAAGAAIVAGWWILFAINDTGLAVIYSAGWTVAVLVGARILLTLGFGYNRLTSHGRDPRATLTARPIADRGAPVTREIPLVSVAPARLAAQVRLKVEPHDQLPGLTRREYVSHA